MRVAYEQFRGTLTSWENLFSLAADFASGLPPGALVSISHSCDQSNGLVTVWYRTEADVECASCGGILPEQESNCPSCGRARK